MKCPSCGEPLAQGQPDCQRCRTPRGDRLELPDGTELALAKETVTLGRGSGNDHVLTDTSISRRHARLQRLPHGWLLIDLGSSNGTWVNGDKVGVPYLLQDGDQLLLGEQHLIFRVGRASSPQRDVGKRGRAQTVLGRSAFGPSPPTPRTDPQGQASPDQPPADQEPGRPR
jgi:pSer/pThr/pTyr-binding forkhead associated (FHA) protein